MTDQEKIAELEERLNLQGEILDIMIDRIGRIEEMIPAEVLHKIWPGEFLIPVTMKPAKIVFMDKAEDGTWVQSEATYLEGDGDNWYPSLRAKADSAD